MTADVSGPAWYVIAGPLDDENGTLYWSNEDGWTVLAGATIFTPAERVSASLPSEPEARWEALPIAQAGMIVLHVWADAEQVYTRLGFHEFIANTDDEQYATDLSNAWQAAREAPGTRVELPEYDREYVVVFTKLTEGGD